MNLNKLELTEMSLNDQNLFKMILYELKMDINELRYV